MTGSVFKPYDCEINFLPSQPDTEGSALVFAGLMVKGFTVSQFLLAANNFYYSWVVVTPCLMQKKGRLLARVGLRLVTGSFIAD